MTIRLSTGTRNALCSTAGFSSIFANGIIEAMSAKDGSRIFAVQFHPEYLSDHDAHAQRLFDHFVKLSREYQSEKEA